MPIYEYRRPDGTTFELQQSFSDDTLTVDPETGVPVERVLHAPAVHFKGKGFYNTDYGTRKRQRENAASSDSSSSSGSSGESSSSEGSSSDSSSAGDSSAKSDAARGEQDQRVCRQVGEKSRGQARRSHEVGEVGDLVGQSARGLMFSKVWVPKRGWVSGGRVISSTLSVRLDQPDLALHDIDGENPALAWSSGISRSEVPRNRLKLPNRQSTIS